MKPVNQLLQAATLPRNQLRQDPARKLDGGKNRYDLLPPEALDEVVKVYTFGCAKYSDHNWRKGMAWSRFFGAMMRHAWAFWRGEDLDPESGIPHLAHAAWNCLALLDYMRNHRKFDDRFTNK